MEGILNMRNRNGQIARQKKQKSWQGGWGPYQGPVDINVDQKVCVNGGGLED